MAIKLRIYAAGPEGDFACYTYDDATGAVAELAVGSLVQGGTKTGILHGNGATFTAPDASGSQVVSVTGLTVSLPAGGPGNFTASFS
jgi:hypothetical protein